ncbi:MAG TPA: hypothetical protein VIH59_35755 [Candidatus Tectomicrobia bacterium]
METKTTMTGACLALIERGMQLHFFTPSLLSKKRRLPVNHYSSRQTRVSRIMLGLAFMPLLLAQPIHIARAHEPCVIDFNNPDSLRAQPDSARFTFANNYSQCGVTVSDGVHPDDPRLGGASWNHFHLTYEDPSIEFCLAGNRYDFGRRNNGTCQHLTDAATEPRSLASMSGDHVIQITYDLNGDGVPDLFDIRSIYVVTGTINVGVMWADGSIGVYNNLTAGTTWNLISGENVQRATLEGIGEMFVVDNIDILGHSH